MSKKVFAVLLAAVFVFGSLATVAQAGNIVSDHIVPFCKCVTAKPHCGWTQGQCVSFFVKRCNGNNWPVKICKSHWRKFWCFKNVGQCVSFLRTWK
jgi:hypothetical protein